MNKILYISTLLFFTLITNNVSIAQDAYKIDKVVIDAGHGGEDPGGVGKHSKEKDIALAVALKVGKLINENLKDVETLYTRDKDVFVKLHKRADIANKAKADLFISIHCNAAASTKAKGTETWIMGVSRSAKNLAVAKKENAVILLEADNDKNYNGFDINSTESFIMFELLQESYRSQSMQMATSVQNQFKNRVNRVDRGVKAAGFLVLVYSTMPSILIELGFISNPEEEKFLLSEKGQDYLASAIYRAFRDYKISMEKGITVEDNIEEEYIKVEVKEKNKVKKDSNTIKHSALNKNIPTKNINAYFSVQFATSSKKVPSSSFNAKDIWHYKHNGTYKYVSGKYLSFKEAKKEMKIIRENGFTDAFVVSFVNGNRVKRDIAEEKIKELQKENK